MSKVSIIITCYNTPDNLLKSALLSVLNQTYRDIELILVNDGGVNDVSWFIKEWENSRGKTIYYIVNQQNVGHSESMNIGISHATGDFFYFMDSDDCIYPTTISRLIDVINMNKLDICVSAYTREFNKLGLDNEQTLIMQPIHTLSTICRWHDNMIISDKQRWLNTTWGTLYKWSIFQKIKFPARLHDDNSTLHRLYWNANKIGLTSFYGYFYRQGGRITSGGLYKNMDMILAHQDRLQFVTNVVQDTNCINNEKCWYLYTCIKTYEQIKNKEILDMIKDCGQVKSAFLNRYAEKIMNEKDNIIF